MYITKGVYLARTSWKTYPILPESWQPVKGSRAKKRTPILKGGSGTATLETRRFLGPENAPIPFKIFQIDQGCEGSVLSSRNVCSQQLIVYDDLLFDRFCTSWSGGGSFKDPLQNCKFLRHTFSSYFHPDALEINFDCWVVSNMLQCCVEWWISIAKKLVAGTS